MSRPSPYSAAAPPATRSRPPVDLRQDDSQVQVDVDLDVDADVDRFGVVPEPLVEPLGPDADLGADRHRLGPPFDAVGTDPEPDLDGMEAVQSRSRQLARPGVIEQLLVIVTLFIFFHQTPNAWFLTLDELEYDYSNSISSLLQFGLVCLAVVRVAGSLDDLVTVIRAEAGIFLFAGLSLLSVAWSADPGESLRRAVMFGAVTLFAAYLVLRFPLERILVLLGWMFVVSALVNLAWILVFPEYGIHRSGAYTGVLAHKNSLGYVSTLGMPTLLLAARSNHRVRFVFYGFTGLLLWLLIRSDSKTMLVAGLLPLVLMVVYQAFRSRRTLRGAALTSITGSGLLGLAFVTSNLDVLTGWLDKDITLTGRVPLWQALLPVMQERLLLGHGWSAVFNGYFSPIHEVWLQFPWQPGDAHNAAIQLILEVGVLGLAVFLVVYARSVLRAIKIVAIVPGPVGLWPLVIMSIVMLVSVTESGIQGDYLGWTVFVVAVLAASGHLKHRTSLGLSNDLLTATQANRSHQLQR